MNVNVPDGWTSSHIEGQPVPELSHPTDADGDAHYVAGWNDGTAETVYILTDGDTYWLQYDRAGKLSAPVECDSKDDALEQAEQHMADNP